MQSRWLQTKDKEVSAEARITQDAKRQVEGKLRLPWRDTGENQAQLLGPGKGS
jgi:hypothetical protein